MISLRLARRELHGGLRGFGVFVACLALGVAAIAAAASLDAAMRRALAEDARALLGGDMEVRLTYRPASEEESAFLASFGDLSKLVEMRAMAHAGDTQTLVELKGVEKSYPLYGQLELDPAPSGSPVGVLDRQDGVWGAAADANLLDRLGLKLGDSVTVGQARFVLRATIRREPDRVAGVFSFGPRLLVNSGALAETGLMQPGALVRYGILIRFRPGVTPTAFREAVNQRFPTAGWQLRDAAEAAPGVQHFLDNLTLFLTLVGLTALLVGGVGVANGVSAFLDGRVTTIATLKCLGASRATILRIYFWQVAALAGLGIGIGLAAGAALPWGLVAAFGDRLPVQARLGLYPLPLAMAGAFGALTALTFSTWPLARAGEIPAATLFRDIITSGRRLPGPKALAVVAVAALALAGLAVVSAANHRLAAWFVGGSAGAFALFALAGTLFVAAARTVSRRRADRTGLPALRLALSSLHRPGNPTRGVVMSLGLGLTVLVAVALVQANLSRQLDDRLPQQAPTFFFIDIQPDQADTFDQAVAKAGGRLERRASMIRGRITRLNGVPVEQVHIAPDAEWAVRGDRGLSTAETQPDDSRVVAGQWWPPGYDGPPLASVDAGIARGFGLSIGDSITVNVLGREIELRIASLREIDWSSLSMNFTFLLSPNALAGAPHSFIATVFAPPGRESAVERAVTDALPNVSAIRVKEALEAVKGVVASVGMAIRAAAGVTLTAGALVLAGAIAAGQRRRIREAVLLKVLGARRADLLRALTLEYLLLGGATGLLAAALGTGAAWAVLVFVLKADWAFLPLPVAGTALAAVAAVVGVGVAGTARALRTKAAPYLRHE